MRFDLVVVVVFMLMVVLVVMFLLLLVMVVALEVSSCLGNWFSFFISKEGEKVRGRRGKVEKG